MLDTTGITITTFRQFFQTIDFVIETITVNKHIYIYCVVIKIFPYFPDHVKLEGLTYSSAKSADDHREYTATALSRLSLSSTLFLSTDNVSVCHSLSEQDGTGISLWTVQITTSLTSN